MSLAFVRRAVWLLAFTFSLAAVHGPAAAFDVLISNNAAARVSIVDGDTGALKGLLLPPCDSGFAASRGPRVGADGLIYVGMDGAVVRFDAASGEFRDVFISGLAGVVQFTVVAPDGSVWGSLTPGNNLFHTDAAGTLLGLVATPSPVGLAIGADGHLYVGSFANGAISRFDATTGAFIDTFGTAPGPVGGIAFDPDGSGRLCVGLPTLNDVGCFDAAGVYQGSFIQAGDPHPSSPRGPSWGPDGNLWVSANATGEVLRYDATGDFLGVFASGLESPGGAGFPGDLPADLSLLPAVDTTSGPVRGLLDCDVREYRGIAYAEPPVGERRWAAPVRKAASPTEILALSHGAVCPQVGGMSGIGNEDCLTLSIWRPDAPPAEPLPVLFFIHGGGLTTGSLGGPIADGAKFAAAQNAIVVETQYRLGALGFLGLPELAAEDTAHHSTGNYGFLDQLEALRWVRDNIAAFGGDPSQVTVAGQSAGAWSVCTLLASPLSDGLFRAGIAQSGTCQNARPLDLPAGSPVRTDPFFGPTIFDRGNQIATNAGCAADPDKLACLRGLDAATLVQAYAALPRNLSNEQPANPAIDGYVLTEQPVNLLRNGAADGRALVIGSVANESTYFSQGWEAFMTPDLYESLVRAAAGNTRADALLPLYPAAAYPSAAEAFRTLIEDTLLVCPNLDAADAAVAGGSPAYTYHLTYPPTYGATGNPGLRTFHGLDLFYVFGTHGALPSIYGIQVGPTDDALSESMQGAWGSFVRTGAPATMPAWPAYEPATPGDLASVGVLQFDAANQVVSGTAFRGGRCATLAPVANRLDVDRDVATFEEDNCPITANTGQADGEADGVGDVCDNCTTLANPRVAPDFLTLNPWATLTGGQRDDDHDGHGNRCDAKFTPGLLVGITDLVQFRASNGKSVARDLCGTTGTQPCAIFDLDEYGYLISARDLVIFRLLNGRKAGPKCDACPLPCTAGPDGSCD